MTVRSAICEGPRQTCVVFLINIERYRLLIVWKAFIFIGTVTILNTILAIIVGVALAIAILLFSKKLFSIAIER